MWLMVITAGAAPGLRSPVNPCCASALLRMSGFANAHAYSRPSDSPKRPRTSRMQVSTMSQVRRLRTGGAYAGAPFVGAPYVGTAGAAGAEAAAGYPGTPYGLVASTGAYSPYCGTSGRAGAGAGGACGGAGGAVGGAGGSNGRDGSE